LLAEYAVERRVLVPIEAIPKRVVDAALTYFNKSLDELTLGAAAFLASLPKSPNRYNPTRHPQIAKARRDWVLDRMLEDGLATQEEVTQAAALPLEPRHRQGDRGGQCPLLRRGRQGRAMQDNSGTMAKAQKLHEALSV
jgi:membrane carboxypeptidase/penicillin-binding protein